MSEDLISREAAIDTLIEKLPYVSPMHLIWIMCDLPSADRPIGEWRHYEGMLTCSHCGTIFYDAIMEYVGDVPKFCPDCGAKMERSE